MTKKKQKMMAKIIKTYILIFLMYILVIYNGINNVFASVIEEKTPIPTDSRIKTFIYSPNEIFQVKFMVGYQSIIELQDGENVELITFGDSTPWDIKVIEKRIFLKATEPGVKTNMNVITDKRTYLMEIMSNGDDDDNDERITYILRFFYPDINVDIPPTTTKLAKIALNKRIAANTRSVNTLSEGTLANAGTLNTNYTYSTKGDISDFLPTMVFDNGSKTYFKFKDIDILPTISAVTDDYKEVPLRIRKNGEYIYIDTIEKQLTIRKNDGVICLFNESIKNKTSIAFINEN